MSNVYRLPALPLACGESRIATLSVNVNGQLILSDEPQATVQRAVSCLIAPVPGDRVRIVADAGEYWITDVLTCADKQRALTLESSHPRLCIQAHQLAISAHNSLSLEAPSLSLLSRTGQWMAEKMFQVAELLQIRSRNAERLISESDRVNASHIQHQASSSYRVDSELTAMNGRTVLKIDGGQVHVG